MSCTKNPADMIINATFIQYAWCQFCFEELERDIASLNAAAEGIIRTFPVDDPAPPFDTFEP